MSQQSGAHAQNGEPLQRSGSRCTTCLSQSTVQVPSGARGPPKWILSNAALFNRRRPSVVTTRLVESNSCQRRRWGSFLLIFAPVAPTTKDRVLACLNGIATGDAVGKQTENLTRDDVLRWYPNGVNGFEGPLGTAIPRYRGNKKHEWLVGETTDDTERTLAVANAIIRDGAVTHTSVGRELLKCRKCVHPGIRSLWEFHESGDPARVAQGHDGCGAAIRVAPVGILYPPEPLTDLVAAAREASISTHGGVLAIAAAAATAAAVSAAIDDRSAVEIINLAQHAAAMAEREHTDPPTTRFADALDGIFRELRQWPAIHSAELAAAYFPNN